jgi:hypothetical protein
MVDRHHRMDDVAPLTYAAVWELLKGGGKLSAVNDGVHLFSFQVRPNGTIKALVGAAYLAVGRLQPDAKRLEAPPPKWKQAPLDAPERRAVYRLFDADLLQSRLPTAFILIARAHFDAANERAYEAAQPGLYRYVIERKLVSFLPSIINTGGLSPGQETTLRKWMAKEARKRFRVVPPADEPASKAEQAKTKKWAEWKTLMEQRKMFPEDYEGEPEPPEPF